MALALDDGDLHSACPVRQELSLTVPLTITRAQIDETVEILRAGIEAMTDELMREGLCAKRSAARARQLNQAGTLFRFVPLHAASTQAARLPKWNDLSVIPGP